MRAFLPSMIEVPFNSYYKSCIQLFTERNIQVFHIDFGDGNFIPRVIDDAFKKAAYLGKTAKDFELVGHYMCFSNQLGGHLEEYIDQASKLGVTTHHMHLRAFKDENTSFDILTSLKKEGHHVGIVIELDTQLNKDIVHQICEINPQWFLVMGVPIGSGGQGFKIDCVDKVRELIKIIDDNKLNTKIEFDGGLSFSSLDILLNFPIERFSGWSIISDPSSEKVLQNLLTLQEVLKG